MSRRSKKDYRIIGAYDSETTNVNDHGDRYAFPILHQLGILESFDITDISADNVEEKTEVHLFRHAIELYSYLDSIVEHEYSFVPVICCHNLSFDMYSLSPWLNEHENVKVLAKSCRKPITFTICDEEGNPRLVIWDTLIFSQQSLRRMGEDCGYLKASGDWDYTLMRTPDTPLSDDELNYAKRDIYTLLVWLSWWLSRNPDIAPEKLGLNVVTKTGVVRERIKRRFDQIQSKRAKYNVGRFNHYICRENMPKTDDELFTMIACTRGGFTFCASSNASKVFECGDDMRVMGYDATSQHPAQICSHRYPIGFHETLPEILEIAFENICARDYRYVLENYSKPFTSGILAQFEFVNIRPKAGSIFEQYGILPLASARFKKVSEFPMNEDNQDAQEFNSAIREQDYRDKAVNPVFAFGKLVKADRVSVFVTELALWEISQCYEWDSFRAVSGYITGKFVRASDQSVLSVMQFYEAKNEFKKARGEYFSTGTVSNGSKLKKLGLPEHTVECMEKGIFDETDVESTYLSLKADLNALFGIQATNEFRRSTVLKAYGIDYEGDFGLCNAPRNPKAWYQFGQRIVGWSRIAQICVMHLIAPHVETVINGDTDSLKVLARVSKAYDIDDALSYYASCIDKARTDNCKRVKLYYPDLYNPLDFIGHYVKEFETANFCASWNKAYCIMDDGRFRFTIAGLPTRGGIDRRAEDLYGSGWSFSRICNAFLGYNVTYGFDLVKLNNRVFPRWGSLRYERITDYLGNTSTVAEPDCIALYPFGKTVNNTDVSDNYENMVIALGNNPDVNVRNIVITNDTVLDCEGLNFD